LRFGLGVEAFCDKQTPGVMGPGVRRDDVSLAPYYPQEIRTSQKDKAPPSGGTFLLSRISVPD